MKLLSQFRESFRLKAFISFTLFLLVIFSSFTLFFYYQQRDALTDTLIKNSELLIGVLSYGVRLGVLTENQDLLKENAEGIFQQKNILEVAIFNREKNLFRKRKKEAVFLKPASLELQVPREVEESAEKGQALFFRENKDYFELWCPVVTGGFYTSEEELFLEPDLFKKRREISGFAKITVDKSELNQALHFLLLKSILIGVFFWGGGALLIFLVTQKITTPLKRLTEGVAAFGSGEEVEAVPVESEDEIGKLAQAFNNMLESLRQREKEKQFLELQLRQAQKMEAIGTMSGGIAHDFNNLLTAIIGFGSLIKMQAKKMEGEGKNPFIEYVDQILASAQRAVTLTQNLLAFSRKQLTSIKRLNLNEVLSDFKSILVRLIREDIEFDLQLTDKELILMADSGQIDQIFMNLVTNARDAMPHGGKLTITTELAQLPRTILVTTPSHYERNYACITVTDTGIGMDEPTKERIFEPFFTTKEVGKGTGLGLSTVYGIVHQYEGYIEVESELGKGTTFKIYLPLIEGRAEEEEKKEIAPLPAFSGKGTILVAEDEDAVRAVVKKVLEEAGYKVIEASNGEEAIEQFAQNENEIDFLLLDVIMPKKNGKEVYQEIRKRKPDIKVLFVTGYAAEVITQQAIIQEGLAVIPKPVLPTELLMKIKDILTS